MMLNEVSSGSWLLPSQRARVEELGERRSALALRLLDEAEALAADGADLHTQVDARALRCRVHVSDRRFDAALEATVASVDAAGPSARREYVVSRALALLG